MDNNIAYEKCGFIYSHYIYNERLVILINTYIDAYHEELLMEKSFLIDSEGFHKLISELRIGKNDNYDLEKLDGIGVCIDILRQADGTHKVGDVSLDEEYWNYCQKRAELERHKEYCKAMREV